MLSPFTQTQTLVFATTVSLVVILVVPCHPLAVPLPRSRQRGSQHQNPSSRDQHGRNQQDNQEEIQVYLAGGPPGSFRGPPGAMSQDTSDDQPPPPTAFSAHRLMGLSVITGSKNITYDKEELDLTNTFEHTKGYFQCQVPGIYYFSFTFWARTSTPLKLRLQHNGNTKAALFVGRGTLLEQASQNAILSLKRGDRVWLEAYGPSIITPSTTPINIFNGYLISALK